MSQKIFSLNQKIEVRKTMAQVSKEKISKLENVLANYPNILSEFEIKEQIIKAFKFEKPLTSIEVDSKDNEKVVKFLKDIWTNLKFCTH